MSWEGDVLLWIQDNLRNPVLDAICKLFSYVGAHGELAFAAALILMIIPKTRLKGIFCTLSLGTTFLMSNLIIKNIVQRPRPYTVTDGLTSLMGVMNDYSFPSGHSASTF